MEAVVDRVEATALAPFLGPTLLDKLRSAYVEDGAGQQYLLHRPGTV